MKKLAINGAEPTIENPFEPDITIGEDERIAVNEVMKSGSLSAFYGNWGENFLGGEQVKKFERLWSQKFNVKHSISVNSNTSGLYSAMAAIGIEPGDEVIVPPYTMSATVMAPLIYGGIPVFADVNPETYCLDLENVKKVMTPKTKAIIAVNLFGHPADLENLSNLAKERGLYLIEDNAQGPLASIKKKYAGTFGDIGVFSLNYHKHIHCGEGGVCVTDDSELALRMQAVRNHAENIYEPAGIKNLSNMVGHNYRLTEMCAAIGIEQLKKIEIQVSRRQKLAESLSSGISDLEGLTPPKVTKNYRHVYYVWGFKFDEEILGLPRSKFCEALLAEGFPNFEGYTKPLYFLPQFQNRIAIGENGWPFNLTDREYKKGLCPITEKLYEKEMICFETCAFDMSDNDIEKAIEAIRKVSKYRHEINLK